VLTDTQNGAPPQAEAVDGSEDLVTVVIGGNDVGYVPLLIAACLPRPARLLSVPGGRLRDLLDRDARDRALADVAESLYEVGRTLRCRAPHARVLFVDYLALLPPPGVSARPLSETDADLGRHVAETPERLTAEAAEQTGCELVRAGAQSRAHHAWSQDQWTTRFAVPLPGRPAPSHPNAAGMRAVAELVTAQVSGPCHHGGHDRAQGPDQGVWSDPGGR
jgi:hypothetical protein